MSEDKIAAGIYEQVINKSVAEQLESVATGFAEVAPIDEAEGASVIAEYLRPIIRQALAVAGDEADEAALAAQIRLANSIIELMRERTSVAELTRDLIVNPGEQLLAVAEEQNSPQAIDTRYKMPRPATSLVASSLFTGAASEPQLFSELKREILSADSIDMLVSFVKMSGLNTIFDALETFTRRGGRLRLITTTYIGATDASAIDKIARLANTEIRICYDTQVTRLHAKAYIFYRATGYDTAYIGSSNLSRAALSTGREWNLKITRHDSPDTLAKIAATFETYWNDKKFEPYTFEQSELLASLLYNERHPAEEKKPLPYYFTIRPRDYQQQILDELAAERELRGQYRNLVIAATGTGKTVIAAFDYLRFCEAHPQARNTLLFVAHREEILEQSLSCFRTILRDPNFGDLLVGSHRPQQMDHLFISIQSFNSREWQTRTSADFYDYIVVDEFHHAAAASYQTLLGYYQPQILLGLTATPERMDGENIYKYFGGYAAAELRLPTAINRGMLAPFHYFGVTDDVDLSRLKWERGGYAKSDLNNVYVLQEQSARNRADLIVRSVASHVASIDEVHAVGFCVSIEHARFMADYFTERGLRAACLTGKSSEAERTSVRAEFEAGRINFIFVVDLYNEGIDIPAIDTILFLRPTESLTIFLQQLGRGLRLAPGKECLTVLDFIGQANKKYRFEEKFAALLAHTRRGVQHEIETGFTAVPRGCYIHLEKRAQEWVLANIRAALNTKSALVQRIRDYREDVGRYPSLAEFLSYYRLDARKIYSTNSGKNLASYYILQILARGEEVWHEPDEELLIKALPRLAMVDSASLLRLWLDVLENLAQLPAREFTARERRALQMLSMTLYRRPLEVDGEPFGHELLALQDSPRLLAEICELLTVNYAHITVLEEAIDLGFDSPLMVYATYSREQLFAALDNYRSQSIVAGVQHVPAKKLDVLLVTLNKSDKDYSETTMYRDYAISETRFHWQSQSRTADTSPTAQRYFNHAQMGHRILLFVREYKSDMYGNAMPYTFLGTANHVSHTGSRPVSIVWELDYKIPARLLGTVKTLAAV